jgi:protease-4
MRAVRATSVWLGAGALLLGLTAASAQIERVPEYGRPLVSTEDTTALVVNPANLAFLPATELRWTGLFHTPDNDAPYTYNGHAISLGVPLPVLPLTAGVRLDLVNLPNYAIRDDYHWWTWGLALPLGPGTAIGATIERSYSGSRVADDLTSVSAGFTSRWSNWFGLAIVGHNLNRSTNYFYELQRRWEGGVSIRPHAPWKCPSKRRISRIPTFGRPRPWLASTSVPSAGCAASSPSKIRPPTNNNGAQPYP